MSTALPPAVFDTLRKHWGYSTLRPLQTEAIAAGLAGRDSLVVLPTGGGKSLCYQLPAVVRGGLTVVISPLIALMKDQVDSLTRMGIHAERLDSSLNEEQRFLATEAIRDGDARLVFISPERLQSNEVQKLIRGAGVHSVAIDEAHCVSHWGHDFRPEYRQLGMLRQLFPGVAIQAFTATATVRVQDDILAQLNLKNPERLVGSFDRPNLTFRVQPQVDVATQVRQVLDRHKGSGGIVYCMRRKDVDSLAGELQHRGYKAVAYHAGMQADERRDSQDAFVNEKADVVVATVAFGMGIDRSNVRFVVHAAMPKSLEHYQQETGRAGRDGLPAECVLLFSGGDVAGMRRLVEKSNEEGGVSPDITAATIAQIDEMARFCRGAVCRHGAIVNYFGQTFEKPNCGACDVCLGDVEDVPECDVIAKKILSCVARVNESFGVNHVAEVLRGSKGKAVLDRGHDKLSTWGLLSAHAVGELRDFVHQLVGQGLLSQSEGEYPVLKLTKKSWLVMKGELPARLVKLKAAGVARSKGAAGERPAGVDDGLFEALRELRKQIAADSGVPPYVVFTDNVLLEFARGRPSNLPAIRRVSGVGDKKLRDYGDAFLKAILDYSNSKSLPLDVPSGSVPEDPPARLSPNKSIAYQRFRKGLGISVVMKELDLAKSTVMGYLTDYIRDEKPATIRLWVSEATEARVRAAAEEHGWDAMTPVYEALNQEVPFEALRLVFARMRSERS